MATESYNPERSADLSGRSRRERIMAEETAGPEGGNTVEGSQVQSGKFDFLRRFRSQEPETSQSSQSEIQPTTETNTDIHKDEVEQTATGADEGAEEDRGNTGGSEGPRPPEIGNKEWETSPERGRSIIEAIVRLRTDPNLSYEQRYVLRDEQGRPLMAQLYKDLQEHVNAICKIRNERNPWDRYVRDSEGKVIGVKGIEESPLLITYDNEGVPHLEQLSQTNQQAGGEQTEAVDKEQKDLTKLVPVTQLTDLYEKLPNATAEQIQTVLKQLRVTGEEQLGEEQLRQLLEKEVIRQASEYFQEADRFGLLKSVNTVLRSIRDDIEGGGDHDQIMALMEQKLIRAKKAAQAKFRPRGGGNALVNRLNNIWELYIARAEERFIDALDGDPQRDYIEGEFRLEHEEQEGESEESYWEVGNYPKYYHITAKTPEQFLIAKESFMKMIRAGYLGKSPEAIYEHVNNFTAVFGQEGSRQVGRGNLDGDFLNDQRLELEVQLYAFVADYSNDSYNPKSYNQAMTALALHEGPERMVRLIRSGDGVVGAFSYIFDKDSLMEIFNNPVGERGELDIIAQHYLQDQVGEMAIERGIGITLKDYDPKKDPDNALRFVNDDDARKVRAQEFKVNLERIGIHMPREEVKALYEGFDQGNAHILNFLRFGQLTDSQLEQLPSGLREFANPERTKLTEDQLRQSPKSLKDSINLGRIQVQIQSIRARIRTGEIKLDARRKTAIDFLSLKDKKAYQDAYDKAKANFDIAFQMQGISGEKVRRGRGFLYVDRNPYIQAYQEIEGKSARIEWLLEEIKKGKKIAEFSEEIQQFHKQLTSEEQTKTPQGLYGINRNKLLPEQQKSIVIGWMLSEIKEDRRLDTFTEQEIALYNRLSEKERDTYVDHIPTYLAEKFVQCAVTLTKIQHANSSAQVRFDEVEKAQARAIAEVKKNGFGAKLKNADGTLMKLKRPKENPDGTLFRNPDGSTEVKDVEVTFQVAADPNNIYNRYTTHTYWGYQGENRHMLLAPHIFEAAERIRNGFSRPEDEDMLASMRLVADPTLNRVREFGRDGIEKEITLLQAAVNESFLDHVRINKDLFKAFLPKSGSRGKMRAGYNMEDWGGAMRFAMGIKEFAASQPARLTRRLGAEIAIMPIYVDAMGSLWGQEGVYGACSTFADQIKRYSHQGVVSQFGITKFIDMQHYAQVDLYNALIGAVQEGKHKEGLYMKPTNDNEILHKFTEDVLSMKIERTPEKQLEFLQQLRGTFGRLEEVLKVMRSMYSDTRNAGGALDLRKVDIFLKNGKFNPAIDNDSEIKMNTGTSRQLESDFYDEFAKWLLSEWPGGGGDIYPEELIWNKFLKRNLYVFKGKGSEIGVKTFKKWFFEKAGL